MNEEKMNPVPSGNLYEIFAINEKIGGTTDLSEIRKLYSKYGNFNHPQVNYDFGRMLSIQGDKVLAKEALLKGASYGLNCPCILYGSPLIDSIGQCMFDLVTEYAIKDVQTANKITCLSYIYLSRCVELYHKEAHDSYRSRALLFQRHKYKMLPRSIVSQYMGPAVLLEPFIISDFYFSAMATNSPFKQENIQNAKEVHAWLEDISVGGREADDYSLEDMASLGEARHYKLFKTLEMEYQKGKFDISIDQLHQLNG